MSPHAHLNPNSQSPSADELAILIQQLTQPTSTNISDAEANLLNSLASSAIIDPLAQLLAHPSPQIRHFAAILLRRALSRHHDSPSITQLINSVKIHILPLLQSEPDPAARRGLVALSAFICKQQNALWNDLTSAAILLAQSDNPSLRSSAFSIFQSLCDTIPDQTLPHLSSIAVILSRGLSDPAPTVRVSALRAYAAAANPVMTRDDIPVQSLIDLLPSVGSLTNNHPDRTSDEYARIASIVFDIFAVIMDAIPQDDPCNYFSQFCRLALQVFSDHNSCRRARSAAVEFLVFAVATRPNALRTESVAINAVQAACTVIFFNSARAAAPPEVADDDVDDGDHDPINLALRLLFAMAKRVELSRLTFSHVMTNVTEAFNQASTPNSIIRPYAAAYRMIGAIAEGCTFDLTLHVQQVIPHLVTGAHDDSHGYPTRARALEALGYVCEALDTEEMPDDVITHVANSALDGVLAGLHHDKAFVCKQACMALEPVLAMFVQESDGLRARFNDILRALGAVGVGEIAEEAVMAIGVLAENAPEAFTESDMYHEVIQWILRVMGNTSDDKYLVRSAATNAAGVLMAHCNDQSVIEQLAKHAIIGLDSEEPELRQSTFSFFAKMADVVGGSVVAVFGQKILRAAVEAMERETVTFVDDDAADPSLFDTGDGDSEGSEKGAFEIHANFLDEKMVAVSVAGAFATACGTDSYAERISSSMEAVPVIQSLFAKCVTLVEGLTRYFQEDVRTSAYLSLCRMAVANHELRLKHPGLAFSRQDLVQEAFPSLSYCMQEDDDIEVVTNVLSWCASFFRHISSKTLMDYKESIVSSLELLLTKRAACQMSLGEKVDDDDDDDNVGDVEGDLMESVGEVIVSMAFSLRGYFALDFAYLLKLMMLGLHSSKSSFRNKGTTLGTIAAVLLYLNWEHCRTLNVPPVGSVEHEATLETTDATAAQLLPIATNGVQSESKTVRQNSMFLIGVIFAHCRGSRKDVWDALPQTLKGLEEMISSGKTGHGALVDNAAGALARIMYANGVPEGIKGNRQAMMNAILTCIPVKNDPMENTTIGKAIMRMAGENFECLVQAGNAGKVLSCLVTMVLAYRELNRKKRGRSWTMEMEVDVCDEVAWLEDGDIAEAVRLIRIVTERVGEGEVNKLKLNKTDEQGLAEMIAKFSNR